jgi:hypothetical protein
MSRLLVATLVLAALVLDPASAHAAAEDASLRIADDGRLLLQEASASGSLDNPLYEARTNIKGCKWYQYFLPWSCCGANSCD